MDGGQEQRQEARPRGGPSVLARFDYTDKDEEVVGRPDPRIIGAAATLLEAGEDDTTHER